MSYRFSRSDDELLIEQVRKFPCIYHPSHKNFKNLPVRENVWLQISAALSKSAEECKSRWKNIRDNYFKQKHRRRATIPRPPKWPLFEHLGFLQNLRRSRKNELPKNSESTDEDTNELELLDKTDDDVASVDLNFSNQKRIKLNVDSTTVDSPLSRCSTPSARILNSIEMLSQFPQQKEEDDIDLFMRSIALSVRKLSPHLVAQAKLQILTAITNLQESSTLNN